jgi:2-(1,2-epoxy-1,2-dihydrophenyl)acetyl-CoA isomerase
MNLKSIKDFSDDDMSVEVEDAVVIFRLKSNVFNLMTDFDKKDHYLELLSVIDQTPEIKVLISIFEPDALGEIAYAQYISNLCGENVGLKDLDGNWRFKAKTPRLRQMFFHQDTIMKRITSKKIIIDCLQGSVVTPFFGETLAADFRFVTENMQFSLSHRKYGLHPSGGLSFFLPRYVGESKAIDLLLNTDTITAKEAKALGLVTRVISSEDFASECILAAKQISQISTTVLETTKCLTYRFQYELENYFNTETKMMRICCLS